MKHMEFTLTIKGDAQELAALLSQIKVPPASKAVTIDATGLAPAPEQSNGHVEPEAEAPAPEAPVKRTRRSTPAVVVEATPEPVAAPAPEPVAAPAPAGTTISHVPVGLDHLRKVMQTKLTHKKQIIEWLGEFGAKNLSALGAEHYEEMYKKLNSLP